MKPILVIQNAAAEGAGLLATLLHARGRPVENHLGWELPPSLRPEDYAALVVLGGAQSAYDTDTYPFLEREIDLCQEFVEAGKAVLGFCLGAQLLALALGGTVQAGAQKELGWAEITLSGEGRADPMLAGLPAAFPVFHFHGDFFPPPPGCANLAASALTACQLFRAAPGVYGFQYHAEIDGPLLESMCRNNADYMAANGVDAEAVIKASHLRLPSAEARSAIILNRWIHLMEERA